MLLPVTLPDTTPVLLLLAGPDESPLKLTWRLDHDQVASLTVREERRALAPHPTLRMEWRSVLPRVGARAFREGLLALGRTEAGAAGAAAALQPVLCPFWPEAHLASEEAPGHFTAPLYAVFEPDGSRAVIVEDFPVVGYAFTLDTMVAPVLHGRFEDWPQPDALTDEAAACSISWVETGPLDRALGVTAGVAAVGPSLHGQAWPLLPFAAIHRVAKAGGVAVAVERTRLGFGRGEAETHHPQMPARVLELAQDLRAAEAATLVKHWIESGGPVRPFWAPSATSPVRLGAAPGGGSSTITLDDAGALLGHAHVWIRTAAGEEATRLVTSIAGNVLTLDAALPFAPMPNNTVVQPLLFVRFARAELALEWSGEAWRSMTELRELPAEYGAASGETHGTNLGPLAGPAWCYEITDGTQTWRRTSYASALLIGGDSYEPAQIEHGELKERINLDASEATVRLRDWAGSPFARYRLERAPAPVELTIYEGVAAGATLSGAAAIWSGRVRGVKWDGPLLTLAVGGFGARLEQPSPRWLLQPTCSSELFNPKACGLDRTQWTFTATRAHPQATGYTHDLTTFSWREGAALPTFDAGYFAGGYVVRSRAGAADQVIGIVDSSTAGLVVTVTLAGLLQPAPTATEEWTLVPGCDGKLETCRVKFENMTRFRGFPFIPVSNPSIHVRRKTNNGGKK